MSAGGLSRRLVDFALALVGHRRGGLGYVAIIAAVLLSSLSGSAVADTAALASVLMPMMRRAGYDTGRAAGLMASGGIIGPVIPPSIGFIVFGVAGNVSITSLFLAGIAPWADDGDRAGRHLVHRRARREGGDAAARELGRDRRWR